ncbi:MAG TPA: matrixin family metalloprotease, partial [Bacteroidaceae bacterium]|nr:matrixin family metalloprotease [Bacteroidaceae bacterium]
SPGKINIHRDTTMSSAGTCGVEPAWDKPIESAKIRINTKSILSVAEIATHELGHALGLDHTKNAEDVMKAGGTNETSGALSANDKKELKDAMAASVVSLPMNRALYPEIAMIPGSSAILGFDLSQYYPPDILSQTTAIVTTLNEEEMFVDGFEIITPFLEVNVSSDPDRVNGTFYLMVNLVPPEPFEPVEFIAYHFIDNDPVGPIVFECPFVIEQEEGQINVNWVDLCTYPFPDNLRATLNVDDLYSLKIKPTGNFEIQLPPGEYTLELFVDDFQGNSASFGMDVIVAPQLPGDLFLRPGNKTYPEPWYAWIGGVDGQTMVQLFASDPDDQIQEVSFYYTADPDLELWMWFYTDHSGFSYAVPGPDAEYDGIADGWAGYLPHALVAQDIAVPLFFKAEIFTGSGVVLEVLSEIALTWDPTPPSDFELNLEEGFVTDQDYITASIIPEHDNFDYAVFNVSAKPEEFTKPIPFIEQTEADSMACGPYALAACLKFFANQGYEGIDGDLDIMALAQALKPYVQYDGAKGTKDTHLASGAREWIGENGGGFTVTGPLPFSEFNTTLMRDKSEGDSLLNGISQNIIPLFQWDSINASGDTIRKGHFMTLSSVHNHPEGSKRRFDFMDPGSGMTVWGDIDTLTGICTNFDDKYPPDSSRVFSTIMICPTEPSPNPSGGGTITQGPELPPVEVPMPDSGGVVVRTRAVNQSGHKSERDVTGTRVRPATYPPGDTAVNLGGPPFKLQGGLPLGGEYSGPQVDDGWFYPIIEGIHLITYSYTYPMGFVTSCNFNIIVYATDFGDAPAPYPTLLNDDGARHLIGPGLYLGQLVDPEPDGQPCPFALGDDQDGTDDEDGVRFLNSFVPGQTVAIEFTVHGSGYINA